MNDHKPSGKATIWTLIFALLALACIPLAIHDFIAGETASALGETAGGVILLCFAWSSWHEARHMGNSLAYTDARAKYDMWVSARMYPKVNTAVLIVCALVWAAALVAYRMTGNATVLVIGLGVAPVLIVDMVLMFALSLYYGHRFEKTHGAEDTWFLNPTK